MNFTTEFPPVEDRERVVARQSYSNYTRSNPVLDAAVEAARMGYSVVDINPQDKRPRGSWKHKQQTAASPEEIALEANMQSFAIVTGRVSGGVDKNGDELFLTCLDFDVERFYGAWNQNVGTLGEGLSVQRTGSGLQVLFKSLVAFRNDKFAYAPNEDEPTGREIAIESRGEGGYCLIAPSLHPSGRNYQWIRGDLSSVPIISDAHAHALVDAAQRLDEAPFTRQQLEQQRERERRATPVRHRTGSSVIEAYNAAHSIQEVLLDCGYKPNGDRFVRPGGQSGSVVILDNCSFHHSSTDPLSDEHKHDAFSVYAYYKHNGDLKAAVKQVAKELGLTHNGNTGPNEGFHAHGRAIAGPSISSLGARSVDDTAHIGLPTNKWAPLQGQIESEDGSSAPVSTLGAKQVSAAPRRRIVISTSNQVKAFETPAALVYGMIYENTVIEICGGPASYKTFITMGMVEAIAGGHTWNGRATKKVSVLYISGEGRGGLGKRIAALESRFERECQIQFITEAVQLHQPEDVEALLWAIAQLPEKPGLIVVDTLARCFVGGDENSARDAGLFVAGVDRVREATGAAVLVLHHLNKIGDARGSTAFNGAFDTIIEAKREDAKVTLRCIKQKDADEFEPMSFERQVIEFEERDEYGNNLTSLVFEATDSTAMSTSIEPISRVEATQERIVQVLKQQFPSGAKRGEIQQACEAFVGRSSFYQHLKRIEEARKITIDSWGVVRIVDLSNSSNPSDLDSLDGSILSNPSGGALAPGRIGQNRKSKCDNLGELYTSQQLREGVL